MSNKLPRLTQILSIFALVDSIGHYTRNATYFLLVVDAADDLTLTLLQHPPSEDKACAVLATTFASQMSANCPMCEVTRQQCLTDLTLDLSDLFSEKPIATPSAHIVDGFIANAHPIPKTALATRIENHGQAVANGQQVEVLCNPADTPRSFPRNHTQTIETTKAVFGYLAHTITVLGAGLASFLIIRRSSVRSPTHAFDLPSATEIDFRIFNFAVRVEMLSCAIYILRNTRSGFAFWETAFDQRRKTVNSVRVPAMTRSVAIRTLFLAINFALLCEF